MKADIQKILLTGEDRPDLYSVHKLVDIAPQIKPQISAEFHGVPINYFDGNGYSACQLELIPEQNWEFEYAVRKNNFRAYYNDRTDPNNPTLACFELINSRGVARWINYKLFGAQPATGIVYGNQITYPDCFDNIDLQYITDTWRLKENIIIKAPMEHYQYTFTLKLEYGVRLQQHGDGSIFFIDIDTEEVLWRVAAPYAYDDADKHTDNVYYRLSKQIYNGIEYDAITVTLDDTDFLSNAVFPITIDPTTALDTSVAAASITKVGYPTPPTWSNSTISSNDNLHAFKSRDDQNHHECTVSILHINTSSIPDAAIVTAASLSLYPVSTMGVTDRSVNCKYSTFTFPASYSQWEDNIVGDAFTKVMNTFVINQRNVVSLSNVANINKTGNTGFKFGVSGTYLTSTNTTRSTSFHFSLTYPADNPILNVTYNTVPGLPSLIAPAAGAVWNVAHTVTWTAATDPDGDNLQYNIDLSIDGGATYPYQIVALTVAGATSQAYDFSAIPASANCKIRIRAYDGVAYGNYAYSGVFTIQHVTDKVNIGGMWKEVDKRYCNIGGVWKEIDTISCNIGGVWKSS